MSNFTEKDTFFTQKTGNSVVVFLVHIKDITGVFLRKRLKSLFLKKQWRRVVGEVKRENLVSHKLISGSNFHREEITKLTFPTSVSPSSERL